MKIELTCDKCHEDLPGKAVGSEVFEMPVFPEPLLASMEVSKGALREAIVSCETCGTARKVTVTGGYFTVADLPSPNGAGQRKRQTTLETFVNSSPLIRILFFRFLRQRAKPRDVLNEGVVQARIREGDFDLLDPSVQISTFPTGKIHNGRFVYDKNYVPPFGPQPAYVAADELRAEERVRAFVDALKWPLRKTSIWIAKRLRWKSRLVKERLKG